MSTFENVQQTYEFHLPNVDREKGPSNQDLNIGPFLRIDQFSIVAFQTELPPKNRINPICIVFMRI